MVGGIEIVATYRTYGAGRLLLVGEWLFERGRKYGSMNHGDQCGEDTFLLSWARVGERIRLAWLRHDGGSGRNAEFGGLASSYSHFTDKFSKKDGVLCTNYRMILAARERDNAADGKLLYCGSGNW